MKTKIKESKLTDGSPTYSVIITQDDDIVVLDCVDLPHAESICKQLVRCPDYEVSYEKEF